MVQIRAARPDDVGALAALMFVEPAHEVVVLSGGGPRAQSFQEALLRHDVEHGGARLVVAEDDGDLVGFAVTTTGSEAPSLRTAAAIAVRTLGVRRAVLAGWRSLARAKVDLSPPQGGVHVQELQVDPRRRGGGIGGVLLDAVHADARAAGAPHVSLTTTTVNPARRLYQRHGYEVVREVLDARYERLTGVPGRVLMVKDLTGTASSRSST